VVDDRQLTVALGRFARVAAHLVEDPVAWLAAEHATEPVTGSRTLAQLRRRGAAVGHILLGRTHPGAPGWEQVPVQERCQWWVRRITAVAVPIAAAPRVTGVLADRVPLQAALGAAAAGLAVCAVAREHGIERPEDWVPLLARVLFGRDLSPPAQLPPLAEVAPAAALDPSIRHVPPPAGIRRRATMGLWRLAGFLWTLPDLFDERPRGGLLWRGLAKLPFLGLAGGLLDERGAVRRAAQESRELLLTPR